MAIPSHVKRRLRETLGSEASEDLVTWMEETHAMRAEVSELRTEMRTGFARLETLIERRISDLMKWSFVFWVGSVLSIAVLAKLIP